MERKWKRVKREKHWDMGKRSIKKKEVRTIPGEARLSSIKSRLCLEWSGKQTISLKAEQEKAWSSICFDLWRKYIFIFPSFQPTYLTTIHIRHKESNIQIHELTICKYIFNVMPSYMPPDKLNNKKACIHCIIKAEFN